jgi:ABC-type Fe3+/spermidine/putrescine transport system ATPase subunit
VIIRPEALILRHDPALPQVRVEQAMYLGSSIEYVVEQEKKQLVVVEIDPHVDRLIEEEAVVGIDFDPASIHLLPSDG